MASTRTRRAARTRAGDQSVHARQRGRSHGARIGGRRPTRRAAPGGRRPVACPDCGWYQAGMVGRRGAAAEAAAAGQDRGGDRRAGGDRRGGRGDHLAESEPAVAGRGVVILGRDRRRLLAVAELSWACGRRCCGATIRIEITRCRRPRIRRRGDQADGFGDHGAGRGGGGDAGGAGGVPTLGYQRQRPEILPAGGDHAVAGIDVPGGLLPVRRGDHEPVHELRQYGGGVGASMPAVCTAGAVAVVHLRCGGLYRRVGGGGGRRLDDTRGRHDRSTDRNRPDRADRGVVRGLGRGALARGGSQAVRLRRFVSELNTIELRFRRVGYADLFVEAAKRHATVRANGCRRGRRRCPSLKEPLRNDDDRAGSGLDAEQCGFGANEQGVVGNRGRRQRAGVELVLGELLELRRGPDDRADARLALEVDAPLRGDRRRGELPPRRCVQCTLPVPMWRRWRSRCRRRRRPRRRPPAATACAGHP